MKTFKDILIAQNTEIKTSKYIADTTLQFLRHSHNLHLLKHFIIPQIRQYIIAITPSKQNKQELLFTFNNYPACVEFNKFHAKTLLHTIQHNNMLRQKIPLESYTKIRGYVPKNNLETHKVQSINIEELHEYAQGDFINHATDPRIHTIFEDIRQIIRLRHRHIQELHMQNMQNRPTPYNIAQKPYRKQ